MHIYSPTPASYSLLFSLLHQLSLPSLEPLGYYNYQIPAGRHIVDILEDPLLWSGPVCVPLAEMEKLPSAVQALHRFWVSNHPWPDSPSREWKRKRDNTLHAVDLIINECKEPYGHPFCCDDLNKWIRDLINKVARYPGFPAIRAPVPEEPEIPVGLPVGHTHEV